MKRTKMKVAGLQTPDWGHLCAANDAFGIDLSLVGDPHTVRKSPFDRPHAPGIYTATDFRRLCHQAYVGKLRRKGKKVLVVGCMDASFAHWLWNAVRQEVGRAQIVSIFNAGGAAQTNEARINALATEVRYLLSLGDFESVWLTGHGHNCGGMSAFEYGGVPVCDALGCSPNSGSEIGAIKRAIWAAWPQIIPAEFTGQVHTRIVLDRDNPRWIQPK